MDVKIMINLFDIVILTTDCKFYGEDTWLERVTIHLWFVQIWQLWRYLNLIGGSGDGSEGGRGGVNLDQVDLVKNVLVLTFLYLYCFFLKMLWSEWNFVEISSRFYDSVPVFLFLNKLHCLETDGLILLCLHVNGSKENLHRITDRSILLLLFFFCLSYISKYFQWLKLVK